MSSNFVGPLPEKSVTPIENVAPSEDIKNVSGTLDDIEEPKVTKELELKACNYSVTPNIKGGNQEILLFKKKLLRIQ